MIVFDSLPESLPDTPLLDRIDSPAQLRELEVASLAPLADELRAFLLYTVGKTGGHLGAGLGVIELTLALHYLLDTPDDLLVWDIGHQCYPHKILTGRRARMPGIRQAGGLAAFLSRDESPYDVIGAGHAGTSISSAVGLALAQREREDAKRVVAVVGDGALTAGMAYEALAHAGHERPDMLVVLNDNQMSISRNIGGVHNYLARIWASRLYTTMRAGSKKVLSRLPFAWEFMRRSEEHVKGMVAPGTLFEELGFNYIGPIDGHDFGRLLPTVRNMLRLPGPQFLHVLTVKGRGYAPAESDPVGYHAIGKLEPATTDPPAPATTDSPAPAVARKYQDVFGDWLCAVAERDPRMVAITPAMREGSGMAGFAERFPERFFDVAIAEQHAATLAAGLALAGKKPVLAIYSTFLQRAYDQLIHDVALQGCDVLFALDRAGLVGEDGPTHSGVFDLSFLRCVPGMAIMTPSDEAEAWRLLSAAYAHPGPAAVRYPRGAGIGAVVPEGIDAVPLGEARRCRNGQGVAILNFGPLLGPALEAAEALDASVADMRFVKPLDTALIDAWAASHELLVTVEDNATAGGAGAACAEHLAATDRRVGLLILGVPDRFVATDSRNGQLSACGLDAAGIRAAIARRLPTP